MSNVNAPLQSGSAAPYEKDGPGETPRIRSHETAHTHAHGENCVHTAALNAVRQGNPEIRRRLLGAFVITALFMVVEVVGGLLANSLALLADAGHMLTDAGALALALAVAWWNARQIGQPAQHARFERREAWAALINAVVLLVVCAAIIAEAVSRLQSPETVETGFMLAVAVAGLCVNIAAALMLKPVVGENLNARGAYVHVLGDLLGSVGTIVAALLIRQFGWLVADPIASLIVSALVLRAAVSLLRDASRVIWPGTVHRV